MLTGRAHAPGVERVPFCSAGVKEVLRIFAIQTRPEAEFVRRPFA